MRLPSWFLALPLLTSLAEASIVVTNNNRVLVNFPTQDAFGTNPQPFSRSGITLDAVWLNDTRCTLKPEVFDASFASMNLTSRFKESILLVAWGDASTYGCDSQSEVARASLVYSSTLAIINLPPIRTLVMGIKDDYGRTYPLLPVSQPGLASSKGWNDGPVSGMDLVLIPLDQLMTLRAATAADPTNSYTTVLQEQGPWNRIFNGVDYVAFRLLLFVISLLLFLHGSYRLVPLILGRQFVFDTRNVVFLLALIASGLICPLFLLREFSFAWTLLGDFVSLFGALSFKLLLILWTSVLTRMYQGNRGITIFRILIWFSVLSEVVVFTCLVVALTTVNADRTGTTAALILATTILNSVSSIITTATFTVYSIQFVRRRDSTRVSADTYAALTKLTYLAWGAAALYVVFFIINIISFTARDPSPLGLATLYMVRYIILLLRIFSLLAVLGLRVPNKTPTVGPSAIQGASLATSGGIVSASSYRERNNSTYTGYHGSEKV